MKKKSKIPHKIEELKNKIYSKTIKISPRERSKIHEIHHNVSYEWKDEESQKPTKKPSKNILSSSIFKKAFIGSIIFFLASALFAVYMFFGESNTVSARNIDINILGNSFVNGGEELPLQIEIVNKNRVGLRNTDLLIEYQEGAGSSESLKRTRMDFGDIGPGEAKREIVNIVLFGQQGSVRDIKFSFEYRVPGSNAIFVKDRNYIVNISSAPVNLLVNGPENIGSNQSVSFSVKTSLNTSESVRNMIIRADYPRGFEFRSATPAPTFGDNIWVLGDLNPGSEREIKIDGVVVAQPGEQRAFNVYVGQQRDINERDMSVQFNSQSYVVSIQNPLLDTRILVNGTSGSEVSIRSGGNVQGRVEWRNSTDKMLTDVEIVAEISGNIINYPTISTDGFFESQTNKIIWNRQNYPSFASIAPGQSGVLSFSFATLPPAIGASGSVSLSIKAKDQDRPNEFLDIRNFSRTVFRPFTNLQLSTSALYYSGPIQNSGPLPPTPGTPTTYTVSLSLVNSTNDTSGVSVRGRLPIYVDYIGSVSPVNESVSFNQVTKEFIWNAGSVRAGTGTNLPRREVFFQVRLNPSTSQINTTPNIVENLSLSGVDTVTNTQINQTTFQPINTSLFRDLNYNFENDKVQ